MRTHTHTLWWSSTDHLSAVLPPSKRVCVPLYMCWVCALLHLYVFMYVGMCLPVCVVKLSRACVCVCDPTPVGGLALSAPFTSREVTEHWLFCVCVCVCIWVLKQRAGDRMGAWNLWSEEENKLREEWKSWLKERWAIEIKISHSQKEICLMKFWGGSKTFYFFKSMF